MVGTGKIYKTNWGVKIRVYVGIDLTDATVLAYTITKPNGKLVTWIPTVVTPKTDGFLTYTTVVGDLDVVGTYKLNAQVTFSGGSFTGETAIFRIYNVGE